MTVNVCVRHPFCSIACAPFEPSQSGIAPLGVSTSHARAGMDLAPTTSFQGGAAGMNWLAGVVRAS
jgi:hypothetical protein